MKITNALKAGYGSASAGDVIISNLIIVYGLYFLTEVEGMKAVPASNIIFAATMLCTISIGIIGYISDRHPISGRKRVPYMLISVVPMTVCLILFFGVNLPPEQGGKLFCFIMLTTTLVAHSCYMVPYEAMGVDVSKDPGVRTALRSYARWFMGAGNLIGVVTILPAVDLLQKGGLSEDAAWRIAIAVASVLAMISVLATCYCFRDLKEEPGKTLPEEDRHVSGLLRDYAGVIRNRSIRILLYITLLMSAANIFFNACIVYYMKHNMGFSENAKAFVLLLMSVTGILLVPVIAKVCGKLSRTKVMGGMFLISGVLMMLMGIWADVPPWGVCALIVVFSIGSSAFWQLIYVLLYEACDLDTAAAGGRKREGVAVSAFRIVLKAANAGAAQVAGVILALFGYDPSATVQSAETLLGIRICVMELPGVFSIFAAICVIMYALELKKYDRGTARLKGAK